MVPPRNLASTFRKSSSTRNMSGHWRFLRFAHKVVIVVHSTPQCGSGHTHTNITHRYVLDGHITTPLVGTSCIQKRSASYEILTTLRHRLRLCTELMSITQVIRPVQQSSAFTPLHRQSENYTKNCSRLRVHVVATVGCRAEDKGKAIPGLGTRLRRPARASRRDFLNTQTLARCCATPSAYLRLSCSYLMETSFGSRYSNHSPR